MKQVFCQLPFPTIACCVLKQQDFILMWQLILIAETLRALYLGDNDFEFLPTEVGQLKNLQIVSRCHKMNFVSAVCSFFRPLFSLYGSFPYHI